MPSYSFGPTGIVTSDGSAAGEHPLQSNSEWQYIGATQGPAPYTKVKYKIAQWSGNQGIREYEIWVAGDSNHHAGGRYIIRLNSWYSGSSFTSVSLRCISGNRGDFSLYPYNNTNGIWIATSFIWGSIYIKKRGYDNGGHNVGSTYCCVDNGGPLASSTSIPSGAQTTLTPDAGWSIENNYGFNA